MSGGTHTYELVTLYQMDGDGDEMPLTSMNRGRRGHACGVYRDEGGQQVRTEEALNSFDVDDDGPL